MTRSDLPPIEGVEAQVMDEVWRQGDVTVRDVMTALNAHKERAYTTYMTVLVRLHKKGLLERTERDGAMRYTPAIDREHYALQRAQADVRALVEQHGDLALSEFAKRVAELEPDQRAALEALATRAPSPRPPGRGQP